MNQQQQHAIEYLRYLDEFTFRFNRRKSKSRGKSRFRGRFDGCLVSFGSPLIRQYGNRESISVTLVITSINTLTYIGA